MIVVKVHLKINPVILQVYALPPLFDDASSFNGAYSTNRKEQETAIFLIILCDLNNRIIMIPEQLLRAYLYTTYFVETDDGPIEIRIGMRNPKIDALLKKLNTEEWAFITAFNPKSEKATDEENSKMHRQLANEVIRSGWRYYEGEGKGNEDHWEAERSLFIVGITKGDALALAKKFSQYAFVYGTMNEAAFLIDCTTSENAETI